MSVIVDKPSPVTGGPLQLRKVISEVTFRGETISYEKSFYHCVDSGLEFVDDELEKKNLRLIYDAYREKHSIPSPEDLKGMREKYGIPSSAMSIILGLGENQYGLYEEGVVPTSSVARLLALAKNPHIMKKMLEDARASFNEKQYAKYFKSIELAMLPAKYEMERTGVKDYLIFHNSVPSRWIDCRIKVSSPRKSHYDEYAYAVAY